ncbi:MAG: hypothetical protein JW822_02170 [Spirochaetales bacterium]|nr:hypothetical protein [Spirochaetales bacterium]
MHIKETDLYNPLKCYLENQGYKINSEVNNCDIVATKGDELIIIELKTRFTISLVAQAVKRKQITDSVYVAVALPQGKNHLPSFANARLILRKLEIGLILVNFLKTKTKVEIIFHPKEYIKKRQHKKRIAIIKEIEGRYAEFNLGGSPVKHERISAYKQETIRIACLLKDRGMLSPKKLRGLGTSMKTQSILSNNVYGWFDRVERGTYILNKAGSLALKKYSHVIKAIKPRF